MTNALTGKEKILRYIEQKAEDTKQQLATTESAPPLQLKNIAVRTGQKEISFPLVSAATMTDNQVQIEWLVENVIEQGSLNLLFGEPASGKSLFALDWGFCIAADMSWHGYRTKQTDVVIIAGEGFAGMQRRLKALEVKYNMKAPESLFISQQPAQLLDKINAQLVANSIKAICPNPGLVIIDTLHRNMDGDENSSQDIGKFINNLDMYMKPLGAAILVVHHSGHGNKDRSRGSSSIRAAMDGEFSTIKKDNCITLTCHKAKDFEALNPLQFTLKTTELGWLDSDDKPMTSVYLEYGGLATTDKKNKLTAKDEAILTCLDAAIVEHGIEPTAEIKLKFGEFNSPTGKMQKIVNIDHWREKAYPSMVVTGKDPENAKRVAFKRCSDKLLNQGLIVKCDNYVWRVFDEKTEH
ncbi:MAG: AAA family ATPase [Methylobacter sp.]|uniref:AAA family ATPase n=1 Tax=Methylobacter sp. TaxID=2051955 RepID=UPI00272F31A9|nr:AAA family ATPase [Methylobacter sp.]MDP1666757.1 AAA family ATPase [Methylobacter sp.]